MLKNIKLFANHSAYEAVKNNIDKPNVVMCQQENEIHFNPYVKPKLIATFNVIDTSNSTKLCASYTNIISQFSEIKIDGIIQPTIVSSYQFNTTGDHVVEFTLIDDSIIKGYTFDSCSRLTSIIIPNSVTTIETSVFPNTGLTNIIIPSSVTSIGRECFYNSRNFISITVEATNPPTLGSDVFELTHSCPIYVPAESVETYKAATNWSDYASRIQAIS